MKLSLFTASLLLTGTLFATSAHHKSATQEGIYAVNTLDTALNMNLTKKLENENNATTVAQVCLAEADRTMEEVKAHLPENVKLTIASLDANSGDATDLRIISKYQQDIKAKTGGAMMMTTAKVNGATRVYKPLVIDSVWMKCNDGLTEVKEGDFKGVIISEVTPSAAINH